MGRVPEEDAHAEVVSDQRRGADAEPSSSKPNSERWVQNAPVQYGQPFATDTATAIFSSVS